MSDFGTGLLLKIANDEITRLRDGLAQAESDRECLKDGSRRLREEFDKTLARLAEAEREMDGLRSRVKELEGDDPNVNWPNAAEAAHKRWLRTLDRAERAEADLAAAQQRCDEGIADYNRVLGKLDIERGERRQSEDSMQADLAAAREVIAPFAEAARWYDRDYASGDLVLWQSRYGISVSLKTDHLWAARAFLERTITAAAATEA